MGLYSRISKYISLPLLASILLGFQGIVLVLDDFSKRNILRFNVLIPGTGYGAAVVGTIMIYTAYELRRAKRAAWWFAYSISMIAVFLQIIHGHHIYSLVVSAVTLLVLIFSHGHFVAATEPDGWRRAFRRAGLITIVTLLLSTIGFFLLKKRNFGESFTLLQSVKYAAKELYFGQTNLRPLTRHADTFLDLINTVGYVNYVLIIASFFKPLTNRYVEAPHVRAQVLQLLERYSNSSEDYFKYWPGDKAYFFNSTNTGFIAYKTIRSVCIALADPITASSARSEELLESYSTYVKERGWSPVFVHVSNTSKSIYENQGYKLLQIGASAVVPLKTFIEQTLRNKNFRNIMNRFEKAGYTVEFLEAPHPEAMITALRRVSDGWLDLPGRSEHGFFLGYFDSEYLQASKLFVMRDAASQIVAFLNLQPNFGEQRASVDMMRHIPDAPTNTMDFIFAKLIEHLDSEGWKELDLGLAPLSNLKDAEKIEEKGLKLIYEHTNRWFAFQGLTRFKDKFDPLWEPSYIAYKGSRADLPMIAYSLDKVMEVGEQNTWLSRFHKKFS